MKNLLYTFTLLLLGLMAQSQTPAITMTTTTAVGSTFSFGINATASSTPIQVDWGNGTLVNYTIGTTTSTLSSTLGGSIVKIYGAGISHLIVTSKNLTALDVSRATELTWLSCYSNQLTTLDVSKNTALVYLRCYSNQLTALDVSKNTVLIELLCFLNQLNTLDVSNNTALKYLYCYSNRLTALDVSKNTALTTLQCYSNQLTMLGVSGATAITILLCYSNQLTTLDVSNNTALEYLRCYSNRLTALDVSKNTALTALNCGLNQLTFNSLPITQPTWTEYTYSPQAPLKLSKENYILSETIDLSSQLTANGNTTTYTWKIKGGATLTSGVDYSAINGVFTFLKLQTDSVYCQMTNATFPDLTLSTTNVKITQFPSGVNETSLAVNIYPNPISEFLNVELTENISRVEVFTITGVKVLDSTGSNTNAITITSSSFPKGMLIVKVHGKSGVLERKIVKE